MSHLKSRENPTESQMALDDALAEYGLDDVVSEFSASGVVWAFPRFVDQVITSLRSGPDVDLWVSRQSFHKALGILENTGFCLSGGSGRPGNSMLVRLCPPTGADAPILEVHVGDYWYPFRCLLTEQDLLATSGPPDRKFLSQLNLVILATVRPAGRGNLVGERLSFARKVWGENSDPDFRARWRVHAQRLLGRSAGLLEKILDSEKPRVRPQNIVFMAAFFYLSSHRAQYLLDGIIRRLRKVWSRVAGVRLTVAALGVDGSGKSSLLTGVRARLVTEGLNAQYIYGGRTKGNSWIISRIRRLVFFLFPKYRDTERDSLSAGKVSPGPDSTPGTLVQLGSLVAYTLDYWLRFGRIGPRFSRGTRISLVDRGPDDFVTVRLPRAVIRFFQYLAPPRHLVLWCDAPARVIWARKRERSIQDIERRQELYRKYIAKPLRGQAARRIDTNVHQADAVNTAYRMVTRLLLFRSGWLDRDLFAWLQKSDEGSEND